MKKLLLIEPGTELKKNTIITLLENNLDIYVAAGNDRQWVSSVLPEEKIIFTDPDLPPNFSPAGSRVLPLL